jgi:PAS domain S-box-containing protein
MTIISNFEKKIIDVFQRQGDSRSHKLKTKLTVDFCLLLTCMSAVGIALFSLPGYKSYFILAVPVLLTMTISLYISVKIKNINLLAWLGLAVQFLMINYGILLAGGNITEISILWSLAMILFGFIVFGNRIGLFIFCIQFAIIFFCIEFRVNHPEIKILNLYKKEFTSNILTLSFPLFLLLYYLYHFIKTDAAVNEELITVNEKLIHLNTSLNVQNKAYANSQKTLSESEKQFRLISDKSRDLICVCNHEGIIKYISPSSIELLKKDSKGMVHKPFVDFVLNEDRSIIKDLFENIKNPEIINNHVQFRMPKSDGNFIWFDAIFQPVFNADGELYQMQSISRDITGIKRHEDSLRLFSNIINKTEEAILIADSHSNIVYVNRETAEMYGFSVDEMLHLSIADIDSNINDLSKWNVFFNDLKIKLKISKETIFLKPNGTHCPVEERWQIIAVEGQQYVIKFINDIEDRKKAEMKIRRNLERQSILSEIAFILNTSDNFDFKINESLRILGNFLKVSRVLMFHNILNGKAVSCTHEWYGLNSLPQKSDLQAIPYSLIASIKEQLDTNDFIEYETFVGLPADIIAFFKPFDIYSLIIVPLKINNTIEGFLCIIDNFTQQTWRDSDRRFIVTFNSIICNSIKQKQTFESLIQSERRFRELAELLPEMVCEAGINGKITFANKHTQVQFGFSENDLQKGKIFFNFFTSTDKHRILENFEKILRSEHVDNEEYTIINREGNEVTVLVYINVIMREHLPVGLRAVLIDISERKEAEKNMLALAQITEESPIAFLRLDKNGEIVYSNKEASVIRNFIFQNYTTHFKELVNTIITNKDGEELEVEISGIPYILYIRPDKDEKYITICGKSKKQIDNIG